MRIVHFAMSFAPIAVFAIVFNTAFTFGTGMFASLFLYVVTVVGGLLLQQFGVYARAAVARRAAVAGRVLPRVPRGVPVRLLDGFVERDAAAVARRRGARSCGCRRSISRFVLTVGSTANQNGTALFEGVTVLFLAQVYALDLTAGQQVRVMLMSIVAGIGTAGVPGGSLPMVMIVAQSVGVPAEGMALILGVDRFLDMCRTAVNVSGDLVIAALVSGRGAALET